MFCIFSFVFSGCSPSHNGLIFEKEGAQELSPKKDRKEANTSSSSSSSPFGFVFFCLMSGGKGGEEVERVVSK